MKFKTNMKFKLNKANKNFIRLSIPNILANLSMPLASLIDIILLGNKAPINDLAAVAVAGLVFDYIFLGFYFLRLGTTGIVANQEGKKQFSQQYLTLLRMLMIAGLGSLVIFAVKTPFINIFLSTFSVEESVKSIARLYFYTRIKGALPALIILVLLGWFLGKQKAGIILFITLLLNGLNIIFSIIFIYVFAMGAYGAGLATYLAQWISAAIAGLYTLYYLRAKFKCFIPKVSELFDLAPLKHILNLSGGITFRTLLLTTAYVIFANFSAKVSTDFLAANVILEHFLITFAYFSDGYAFSLEALAGKYFGKGDYQKMRKFLRIALGWAMATSLVVVILFLILSDNIYPFVNHYPQVIALAKKHEFMFLLTMLVGTIAYIYDGYFIGLADAKILWQTMLVAFLFGFLPIALLADYRQNTYLLWFSLTLFMAVRGGVMAMIARRQYVKLLNKNT